jgi:hypothetical protein
VPGDIAKSGLLSCDIARQSSSKVIVPSFGGRNLCSSLFNRLLKEFDDAFTEAPAARFIIARPTGEPARSEPQAVQNTM